MNSVRLIPRQHINLQRWDVCISQATHSLPYGFSWYLDAVAEHWDALVLGDYEAVMPLVWLRKLGVKCLYQPYYCQQLGVFSAQPISETHLATLLHYCVTGYPYVSIQLNPCAAPLEKKFQLKTRKNLLLDLSPEYPVLRKKYTDNLKRNIAKAQKAGLTFSVTDELSAFRQFYLGNIDPKKENFKPKHQQLLLALTDAIVQHHLAVISKVVNEKGEWLAAAFIVQHRNRWINLINTSNAAGKQSGASHFLFDSLIQQHCQRPIVLDFEGSSIPSIARFYESFGAQTEGFYHLQHSLVGRWKQRFL